MPPVKPGYKTTELAVIVLTIIGQVVAASADWLPPRYAALGAAIAAAAYALSRGLAKRPVVAQPITMAPTPTPLAQNVPPVTTR